MTKRPTEGFTGELPKAPFPSYTDALIAAAQVLRPYYPRSFLCAGAILLLSFVYVPA
ncbi:hypothetical protein EMIT0P2_60066 [Pseudomonas sp. IT-P2]